jgi:kynurenine formamidase
MAPSGDRSPFAGRLNLLDGAVVKAATELVRSGEVISLNLELAQPWLKFRPQPVRSPRYHNQLRPLEGHRERFYVVNDDDLSFALQGSSHLDAFAHFGLIDAESDSVYYGGIGLEETYPEPVAPRLGIHAFQPGIVTRGVLLDLVAHLGFNETGHLPLDRHVTAAEVTGLLDSLGLALKPGDAVLCFTGFQAMLRAHDGKFPDRCAGMDATTVELWVEAGTALIAADNLGIEPFPTDYSTHIGAARNHGIVMGQLWALEHLAQRCHEEARYEFLLTSVPLNLPGAFGSPANAVAVL